VATHAAKVCGPARYVVDVMRWTAGAPYSWAAPPRFALDDAAPEAESRAVALGELVAKAEHAAHVSAAAVTVARHRRRQRGAGRFMTARCQDIVSGGRAECFGSMNRFAASRARQSSVRFTLQFVHDAAPRVKPTCL
jgi:hypothetical protein